MGGSDAARAGRSRSNVAFRRRLAARLLAVVGAGGAASSAVGCPSAPAASPTSDSSRSKPVPQVACFAWPGEAGAADARDAGACPSLDDARRLRLVEDDTGCGGGLALRGAAPADGGQCCYEGLVYPRERDCHGRPLVVDRRPVLAAAASSVGWSSDSSPALSELSRARRDALARTFERAGLLEHASVAAFARFSIELMKFGAPSDLVAAAHVAALDEIRHAEMVFGLASAYADARRGPTGLPLGASLPLASTPLEMARSVILEGCVGETIAAATIADDAMSCADDVVQEILASIAEDEARHAELAWATLGWLLRETRFDVRAVARATFDTLPHALGRLDPLDAAIFDEVVLPCARAALA